MNLESMIYQARLELAELAKARIWSDYRVACLVFADLLDEGFTPAHAIEANVARTWEFKSDGKRRSMPISDGIHHHTVRYSCWTAEGRFPRHTLIVGHPFPFPLLQFEPGTLVMQTSYYGGPRRTGGGVMHRRERSFLYRRLGWGGFVPPCVPPAAKEFWEFLSRNDLASRLTP